MDTYRLLDLYKAKIDERRPFEGEMLSQLKDYYRIGLTWSSNALEGNTLSESETKVLLEDGLSIGGKPLRYTFEAIGHAKAYDFMFTLLKNRTITERDILTMHKMFYESIESEYAGKYRDLDVFISGSKYPETDSSRIQTEMDELFQWIEVEREKIHPVVFAAQLHKRRRGVRRYYWICFAPKTNETIVVFSICLIIAGAFFIFWMCLIKKRPVFSTLYLLD